MNQTKESVQGILGVEFNDAIVQVSYQYDVCMVLLLDDSDKSLMNILSYSEFIFLDVSIRYKTNKTNFIPNG